MAPILTDKRDAKGRFMPGVRPAGRKKGVPNRSTLNVKLAFIEAATRIGSNGKGLGGLRGFIERVGRSNPEALLLALARLIPPPAKQEEATPAIGVVNVVAVPAGRYLSQEQARSAIEVEYAVVTDEDAA